MCVLHVHIYFRVVVVVVFYYFYSVNHCIKIQYYSRQYTKRKDSKGIGRSKLLYIPILNYYHQINQIINMK